MRECSVCRSCFSDSVDVCAHDGQPVRPTLPVDLVINGRYQLIRRVGSGSISVVYLARELQSGSDSAVKIILPDFISEDRKIAEQFLAEATAASALRHPNIVAVNETGLLTGLLPFLVMDLIHGSTLQQTLSNTGPLKPSVALDYISTIGGGLAAAHDQEIFHGDLKPRSILIEADRPLAEAIRITDFGNSAIKSGRLLGPAVAKSNWVLRSPLYLAPEEFSEEASDYRSDIYSLGVILYEMLSGDVPFRGKSIPAIMKRHLMDAPPSIAGRAPGVTPEVERVVMHALEKDPERRPRTVAHFIDEFRHAVRSEETIVIPFGEGRVKPVETELQSSFEETLVPGKVSGRPDEEEPFLGELTLVNFETEFDDESAEIDLNKTIVIAKTGRDSIKPQPVMAENERVKDRLVERSVTPKTVEPDFEMTILPGMMSLPSVEPDPLSVSPSEDPAELPATYEYDEYEAESDQVADAFRPDSVNEDEPVQRSVSPVLLAAGVLVFIVLIALGVYYSRISQ